MLATIIVAYYGLFEMFVASILVIAGKGKAMPHLINATAFAYLYYVLHV